jgi:LuxR family maltose regulon positive regulatory protein
LVQLSDYPVVARVRLGDGGCWAGQVERAQATGGSERLLSRLTDFPPWYEAETRIALARACVRLDDRAAAETLLGEASKFLERMPDATVLAEWQRDTLEVLESVKVGVDGQGSGLTKAELRILQYLPSHLSFREIGEEIHLSPNTVKTQARAVYRKLGASSRAEAVERARSSL